MQKFSNVLAGLLAAGVCGFVTWLTFGSSLQTVIYNLAFLAVMLIIIAVAMIFGFRRMRQTIRGLDGASAKLIAVYKNRAQMADITRAGAQIFGVEYLDRKYQEYLGYLRKTNSPADIGDYIGEYEINNYTHRRLVEMVPDVLTSMGILGTFIGLVWGLQGFNPVSYEAMASSITSLIDGIKVAFVTSIYGLSLSLAYSLWLRRMLTSVSESLDNFLDKYYLCAVSPTDATAMNHVIANQKEQTRVLEDMTDSISQQLTVTMSQNLEPIMNQMSGTLDHFTDVVTLNQQQLLENVSNQVMTAMKKEFFSEFADMRVMLKEMNKEQKQYIEFLSQAQTQFEQNLKDGASAMSETIATADAQRAASSQAYETQQQHMSEYAAYMSQAMDSMTRSNEQNSKILAALTRQVDAMQRLADQAAASSASATRSMAEARKAAAEAEKPTVRTEITDLDELTDRMDQMITLLEKQQRAQQQKKKGLFG